MRRGEDTEGRQRPSVYYNLAADKNFVFTVPSMFGIDFNLELSSQPRRHPDGMKSGDSICTIANQYSSHAYFLTSTNAKINRSFLDVQYINVDLINIAKVVRLHS